MYSSSFSPAISAQPELYGMDGTPGSADRSPVSSTPVQYAGHSVPAGMYGIVRWKVQYTCIQEILFYLTKTLHTISMLPLLQFAKYWYFSWYDNGNTCHQILVYSHSGNYDYKHLATYFTQYYFACTYSLYSVPHLRIHFSQGYCDDCRFTQQPLLWDRSLWGWNEWSWSQTGIQCGWVQIPLLISPFSTLYLSKDSFFILLPGGADASALSSSSSFKCNTAADDQVSAAHRGVLPVCSIQSYWCLASVTTRARNRVSPIRLIATSHLYLILSYLHISVL